MLSVNHNPIEPERDSHLRDAGRFERDPQTKRRLISGQLATQGTNRVCLHEIPLPDPSASSGVSYGQSAGQGSISGNDTRGDVVSLEDTRRP